MNMCVAAAAAAQFLDSHKTKRALQSSNKIRHTKHNLFPHNSNFHVSDIFPSVELFSRFLLSTYNMHLAIVDE